MTVHRVHPIFSPVICTTMSRKFSLQGDGDGGVGSGTGGDLSPPAIFVLCLALFIILVAIGWWFYRRWRRNRKSRLHFLLLAFPLV